MLKPWPASTQRAWLSGWEGLGRKSLDRSVVFEEVQMPTHQKPVVVQRPLGPAGVFTWSITSAIGCLVPGTTTPSFLADSKALIGLWIAKHLPALRQRLLLASSHASTSGSMASL